MKRLTKYHGDGCITIKGCTTAYKGIERKGAPASNAIVRLAAYEDTGLDPEEINRILDVYGRGVTLRTDVGERLGITKDIQTERLKELSQAEKDGLLVVLPCKIGQTLWTESPIEGKTCSFEAPDIAWIIENMKQFGKEIFLTREEAEAALKKREGRQ